MTLTVRLPDPLGPGIDAQSPPAAATRVRRPRLLGVDATRGVALLGMMAVHSLYQSTPDGRPTWSFAIFGGRAAAAFAVLAGVSIAFMTGRRRVRSAEGQVIVAAVVVRAALVGAIGLLLGYTDAAFAAVILPYYALMFVLAIPLLFLPTWAVATVGAVAAVGAPALSHALVPHLPRILDNPTVSILAHDPAGLLSQLSITGEFPALPWMAYLCAGLVIGRLALHDLRLAFALAVTGTLLAVAASVASSILLDRFGGLAHIWAAQPGSGLTSAETAELLTFGGDGSVPASTWWWLAFDGPHTSTPLDLLGTTGTAIALLGVMLLAGHVTRPGLRRLIALLQAPLAAAGSMTLTLYTAHVWFINSDFDTADSTTGYVMQVVAALAIGLAWRATMGRGPLEGLLGAMDSRARRWANRARGGWRPILARATARLFGEPDGRAKAESGCR